MFTGPSENLAERLKEFGILPTQQRLLIAGVLFDGCRHFSADQVLRMVNGGEDHVSKATVYNTLGLFAQKGLIREVIVDPTRVFYDPNTSHHHHFYNIDTGELTDINAADLAVSRVPELPAGTTAAGVDVIVRIRNTPVANQAARRVE